MQAPHQAGSSYETFDMSDNADTRGEETNRAVKDLLIGSLARTELETVLGLPAPALFTPVTLNSYSTSPSSPSTVNLVSENNKTCKLIMKTEDMCRVNTAKKQQT